jgi:hypothetical protein
MDRLGGVGAGRHLAAAGGRPLHRADAPLQVPAAGPAGTRRLGTGRRTGLRPGPRRRPRRSAGPQGPPRRTARPPRQLSFTAARRAAITSTRQGTAAAGLPAATVAAGTARLLAAVGRARHVTDRNRHRPRNTKARQAFEKAHRNTPTWIAEPSWTSAARPPDQGKPASPYPLRKASRLPDPAAPARHADCSVDSVGLPAPRSIRLMSACRTPDRSASARWESPQATRASRYCSVSPERGALGKATGTRLSQVADWPAPMS